MRLPPITVVMPVHNGERTVVAAIRSTLRAMSSSDTLMIVDDGSTDSTPELLTSILDARVKVLRNPEKMGVSSTLNLGIESSKTELIARMDADDICLPWRFILQRRWINRTAADFVFSNCLMFFEARFPIVLPNVLTRANSAQLAKLMLSTNPLIHPTAFFRRNAFTALGGYRSVPNEDFDLWQRALVQGFRLERFGLPTLVFRSHSGQVTQTKEWVNKMKKDSTKADIEGLTELSGSAKLSLVQRLLEIPTLMPKKG